MFSKKGMDWLQGGIDNFIQTNVYKNNKYSRNVLRIPPPSTYRFSEKWSWKSPIKLVIWPIFWSMKSTAEKSTPRKSLQNVFDHVSLLFIFQYNNYNVRNSNDTWQNLVYHNKMITILEKQIYLLVLNILFHLYSYNAKMVWFKKAHVFFFLSPKLTTNTFVG